MSLGSCRFCGWLLWRRRLWGYKSKLLLLFSYTKSWERKSYWNRLWWGDYQNHIVQNMYKVIHSYFSFNYFFYAKITSFVGAKTLQVW